MYNPSGTKTIIYPPVQKYNLIDEQCLWYREKYESYYRLQEMPIKIAETLMIFVIAQNTCIMLLNLVNDPV